MQIHLRQERRRYLLLILEADYWRIYLSRSLCFLSGVQLVLMGIDAAIFHRILMLCLQKNVENRRNVYVHWNDSSCMSFWHASTINDSSLFVSLVVLKTEVGWLQNFEHVQYLWKNWIIWIISSYAYPNKISSLTKFNMFIHKMKSICWF